MCVCVHDICLNKYINKITEIVIFHISQQYDLGVLKSCCSGVTIVVSASATLPLSFKGVICCHIQTAFLLKISLAKGCLSQCGFAHIYISIVCVCVSLERENTCHGSL